MISRLDITDVLRNHVHTMSSVRTGKILWGDILLFYALPLAIGIAVSKFFPAKTLIAAKGDLLTAVSIIGGFLFALFAYIVTVLDKLQSINSTSPVKNRFAREIHTNIAYTILISLLSIVLLVCTGFLKVTPEGWEVWGKQVFFVALYAVLLHFLFSLVMVIRRVYIVVDSTINP